MGKSFSIRPSICLLAVTVWTFVATASALAAPPATLGLPVGDPAQHGISEDQINNLRAFLNQAVKKDQVPGGLVAAVHQGEVVLVETFGWADRARQRPFTPDTPVRIASITKPIVATVILTLVADKVLSLDQPIDTYLPDWKKLTVSPDGQPSRAPTLAEALSHTSGLAPDKTPGGSLWLTDWAREKDRKLGEVIERMRSQGLVARPGTTYGYSGAGYDLAVHVAEVVTKTPFEKLLAKRLGRPLGWEMTTLRPSAAIQSQLPLSYTRRAEGLKASRPFRRDLGPDSYVGHGGAIVATPGELVRFLELHRLNGRWEGKQIVPVALLERMRSRPEWSKTGYGLGWSLGPTRAGKRLAIHHRGSTGTMAWIDFSRDLVGIVLTQMPEPSTEVLGNEPEFRRAVRERVDSWFTATAALNKRR